VQLRIGERLVKKGRHRRFEEARSLKRAIEVTVEPCPECGADPEEEHASWCLYESEELEDDEGEILVPEPTDDPLPVSGFSIETVLEDQKQ
jgi:hypothetical protein